MQPVSATDTASIDKNLAAFILGSLR